MCYINGYTDAEYEYGRALDSLDSPVPELQPTCDFCGGEHVETHCSNSSERSIVPKDNKASKDSRQPK